MLLASSTGENQNYSNASLTLHSCNSPYTQVAGARALEAGLWPPQNSKSAVACSKETIMSYSVATDLLPYSHIFTIALFLIWLHCIEIRDDKDLLHLVHSGQVQGSFQQSVLQFCRSSLLNISSEGASTPLLVRLFRN